MSVKFYILTASKEIKPFKAELRLIAKSAVTSIKKLLSVKNLDIVFYDNPSATFNEGGASGIGISSPNSHSILVSLNPRHPNFKNALKNELPPLLSHKLKTMDI